MIYFDSVNTLLYDLLRKYITEQLGKLETFLKKYLKSEYKGVEGCIADIGGRGILEK